MIEVQIKFGNYEYQNATAEFVAVPRIGEKIYLKQGTFIVCDVLYYQEGLGYKQSVFLKVSKITHDF